jgi:hypothetical protein
VAKAAAPSTPTKEEAGKSEHGHRKAELQLRSQQHGKFVADRNHLVVLADAARHEDRQHDEGDDAE